MFKVRDTLTVAMAEPQSLPTIDRLRQLTGCKIRPVLALEANITEFIKKYAGGNVDVDAFLTSLSGDSDVEVVERETVDEGPTTDLDKMVAGSPIINLVNVALLTAVKDKRSDIHIEPDKKGTRIRYRIDGVLRDLMKPPPGMHAAIVVAHEGHREDGHRREAPAAGRPRAPRRRGARDRPARQLDADAARREAGDPHSRQAEPAGADGGSRLPRRRAGRVQAHAAAAARAGAGHRPDRQRQDDDALFARSTCSAARS